MKINFLKWILLLLSFNLFASGFMEVATVSKLRGDVFAGSQKLKVGDELMTGMEIKALGKKTFVEFKFQNGHQVRMVNAEAKVENIDPKVTTIQLIKGKIFSALKKLTPNEGFEIKTKYASMAVRGTQYLVEAWEKKTYVCVLKGTVEVQKTKEVITLQEKQHVTVDDSLLFQSSAADVKTLKKLGKVFKSMGALE